MIRALSKRLSSFSVRKKSSQQISQKEVATQEGLSDFFPPGLLAEWLTAADGSGCLTLVLRLAACLLREKGLFLAVDDSHELSPLAWTNCGLDLRRSVLLRPEPSQFLWTLEQTLRTPGATVVLARIEHLPERAFRRLKLAAETAGNIGFLIRPARFRREPTWADIRWLVRSLPPPDRKSSVEPVSKPVGGESSASVFRTKTKHTEVLEPLLEDLFSGSQAPWPVRCELLRHRAGLFSATCDLDVNDASVCQHLVSQLARATAQTRAAGA